METIEKSMIQIKSIIEAKNKKNLKDSKKSSKDPKESGEVAKAEQKQGEEATETKADSSESESQKEERTKEKEKEKEPEMPLILQEGIDTIEEIIYESNHPYTRGKREQWGQTTVPGAIGFYVEIDPNFEMESSDSVTISSWVNNSPVRNTNTMSQNGRIGHALNLSGKPTIKHSFILIGNTITGEFNSEKRMK